MDKNAWHMPGWTAYYLGLVTLGVVWKAGHLLQPTSSWSTARAFVLLVALYCLVTFVANWQVRSPWMLAYPLYAFVQAIAMPTVGAAYYCMLAVRQRRFGRYAFGYRRWRRGEATPAPVRLPPRGPYELTTISRFGIVTPPALVERGRYTNEQDPIPSSRFDRERHVLRSRRASRLKHNGYTSRRPARRGALGEPDGHRWQLERDELQPAPPVSARYAAGSSAGAAGRRRPKRIARPGTTTAIVAPTASATTPHCV